MTSTGKTRLFAQATLASLTATLLTAAAYAADGGPRHDGVMGGRGMGGERMLERVKERCDEMKDRLAKIDRDLSADQIRDIVLGRLAEAGNDTLKVGKVTAKGEDLVALEIVTKSGAQVNTREFSTKTGLPAGAEQRCDRAVERMSKAAETGAGPRPGRPERRGPMMGGPMMGGAMMGSSMGGARSELGLVADAGPDRDLNLNESQVRKLAEAGLILMGNPRLKVGEIRAKDADTYVVDLVAADNSLVLQRTIDKRTGRPSPTL